jgi:hypothetical protein
MAKKPNHSRRDGLDNAANHAPFLHDIMIYKLEPDKLIDLPVLLLSTLEMRWCINAQFHAGRSN